VIERCTIVVHTRLHGHLALVTAARAGTYDTKILSLLRESVTDLYLTIK
jgi:hypothetical protein